MPPPAPPPPAAASFLTDSWWVDCSGTSPDPPPGQQLGATAPSYGLQRLQLRLASIPMPPSRCPLSSIFTSSAMHPQHLHNFGCT